MSFVLQDAEATCTGEDAHLVSIVTIAEDSFVWAAAQESGFNSLWTGLMNKKVSQVRLGFILLILYCLSKALNVLVSVSCLSPVP